jgi:hypothetical protein
MVHPGVLRRLKKINPQNESERRLLWYSFVHSLQSTFLFGRLLCGVATLKERKGRGDMKLKRRCSTWSPCHPGSRSSQHGTGIFSEQVLRAPAHPASAAVVA